VRVWPAFADPVAALFVVLASLPRKDFERVATEEPGARPDTESGEHEHALSDGLHIIRAAMDESFAGVLVTDADGVIEYVNRSFETTSGYCAADLIGRSIAGLSEDDDLDQSIAAAVLADGHWRGEIKNKRADGEAVYLLATIQPLRAEDGEIRHYVGVNIDITERVKAEEGLAEREAYWRALVENAPDHILSVDRDGVITSLNWTVPGMTVDEAVGRTVYDFVLEEYHDVWREALADVFASGQRAEFEVRTAGGPLETQWYANTLSAVYAGDTVTAAIISSRNITARKKVEEELAEREAFWRALVENAPDHILAVDKDGVITSLNWIVHGATVDEVAGPTVYDFVREEYHDAWREALAEVFAGGRRVEVEARTIGGPGDSQWYANVLGPVYEGDTVVAAISSTRNVTARKETEERMRAIATAVSDVIVVMDEDGLLLEVLAPRAEKGLLPLPPEDIRGRRLHEFLPPDQAEQALGFVRETISSGKPGEDEALFDLPGGPTWVSSRSAPLSLGDGRTVAVIHALDVSERKRLEEELQRLREETEAEAEESVKRASEYGLTFREITVLSLIARGKSDKEIAVLLGLSPFTVNKHSSNLVRKLGARSRSQAAARAVREYII